MNDVSIVMHYILNAISNKFSEEFCSVSIDFKAMLATSIILTFSISSRFISLKV